jgi:hypothetical protein
MKIMVRAAFAAVGIASIGLAYADGDAPQANARSTEIAGVTAAQPPASSIAKLYALRARLVEIVDPDVIAVLADPCLPPS